MPGIAHPFFKTVYDNEAEITDDGDGTGQAVVREISVNEETKESWNKKLGSVSITIMIGNAFTAKEP